MLLRLLLFFVIVAIVLGGARRLADYRRGSKRITHRDGGRVVRCEVCGVHIPERDARRLSDDRYQCKSHEPSDDH